LKLIKFVKLRNRTRFSVRFWKWTKKIWKNRENK